MPVANVKPRLRMATLYFVANSLNYLVAGTGNRSELTIGYFTKYGDGGVDLLPIGSLLKSEVRKLARELGVPQPIIDKPPSAGLWVGQTDEEEMGFSYADLERYLTDGPRRGGAGARAAARADGPRQRAQARDARRRPASTGGRATQPAPTPMSRSGGAGSCDDGRGGSILPASRRRATWTLSCSTGSPLDLEPDQLVFEAAELQRPDRVDRARTQPRVLARQQRPDRLLRRLQRRADDAVRRARCARRR